MCINYCYLGTSESRLKAGGEGATEDEIVGWHHQLNGYEFEQTLEDGEGQGRLVWGHKKLDTI